MVRERERFYPVEKTLSLPKRFFAIKTFTPEALSEVE
jgi:hypothetical protein